MYYADFTKHEIASRLNKDDLITRVGPGEYVIKRTTYSENRIVTLIPKTYSALKCSCPATDLCAHLIGCQIFLGSFDHETKKPKNTTMALKNNRKANDKTSGRKQPRKLDVDAEKTKKFPVPTKLAINRQQHGPPSHQNLLHHLKGFPCHQFHLRTIQLLRQLGCPSDQDPYRHLLKGLLFHQLHQKTVQMFRHVHP